MTDRPTANGQGIVYVDSSALVKLVKREQESRALQAYLRNRPLGSSAIARTEVLRAILDRGASVRDQALDALRKVNLLALDDDLLDAAGKLLPPSLRALDAIHVASAMTFGTELSEAVTYDKRMAEGFRLAGVPVVAPGT